MDISGITSMLSQTGTATADTSVSKSKADGLTSSAAGLSSESTEEELKEVLRDFESYFLEQIIKKMKDTFTSDDEESSTASQYTDTFMDYAIEEVADQLLDEIGGNLTQQLFEQMKRNYNIPTVSETETTVTEGNETVVVESAE